jgi:hypothetical protein
VLLGFPLCRFSQCLRYLPESTSVDYLDSLVYGLLSDAETLGDHANATTLNRRQWLAERF